ncbi:bifunctional 2-keto-4-hydroxyglutarate aldolase/2-keto-3-deoxy-6-phosphogluconate aldolase [Sutcliffiella halmapala]|uniref:bifunctional 2-keto-4-hydroxyglutarate aldolase/2-keto-3-deoxy-6-phosphogluconate aldolase n=1 Tax=Sutcliffiella halmapala TaxID=79882 RepID=UPI001B801116|nr:bifunctional 2-keto-4-hydroxyglutarate aldolase/2-keto-3-deoxy-6-phosphogluconate aldolase [Sutcliffiella halmapala]
MIQKFEVLQSLSKMKLVAVIRGKDAEEAISISKAAIKGGVNAIEVTYTTPNIERVFDALADEQAVVGAGTVLDAETARHALLHSAKFIVSPHFSKEISELCNRYSVPYLPGCLTISEIVRALESGCDIVKLFPANNMDPSFIKSVNGPIPQVRMMPTGGIHTGNITEWLDAGAFAVGIGSDLTKAYHKGGEAAVIDLCQKYLDVINKK